MELKIRHRATILFFGLFLLISASTGVVSFAQSGEGFVTDGESLNSLSIGKSTMDEVVAVYGDDYKLIKHKDYSFEMVYKNLGLSFFSCQADPNKEIFVIEMESPAKITTSKGITLGESTFADLIRIYDLSALGDRVEFGGMYFYAGKDSREDGPEVDKNQRFVINLEEEAESPAEKNTDTRIDQSNIILDGIDVSENSGDRSNNVIEEPAEENSEVEDVSENQTERSNKKQADDEKQQKAKIVRRIDLVEKTGLRQCDDKFPKRQK